MIFKMIFAKSDKFEFKNILNLKFRKKVKL